MVIVWIHDDRKGAKIFACEGLSVGDLRDILSLRTD
jgi:hypothetical protein